MSKTLLSSLLIVAVLIPVVLILAEAGSTERKLKRDYPFEHLFI
jgi:hypothetical protein